MWAFAKRPYKVIKSDAKFVICPRTPEGGQSVKATFLMQKTSKKGEKVLFVWAFAKRPYKVIKSDAKFVICPRAPKGGQSVKATFLMKKTSKKRGVKSSILRGRLQNARTQYTLKVFDFHLYTLP